MINRFIHSKTIPDSRPKWAKSIPVFRLKRRKNYTLWGSKYLYGLHEGAPLTPPVGRFSFPEFLYGSKRSKHFSLDDHFPISHFSFSLGIRRKLVLMALETKRVNTKKYNANLCFPQSAQLFLHIVNSSLFFL